MQEKFFIKDAIGIDEVGKGALAGPVVACAVLFNSKITESFLMEIGVDDSKALTPKKRYIINEILMKLSSQGCLHYGIGAISSSYIDEYGITIATNNAMKDALTSINCANRVILVDGIINPFKEMSVNVETIVKGDFRCYNIAAASIIAKVFRDKIMDNLSVNEDQCYNWSKNKGYHSTEHMKGISYKGLSLHHRQSFCKKLVSNNSN
jgi:ribonuclease HII